MNLFIYPPLRLAIILGGLSLIGLSIVSLTFHWTREKIEENQQLARLALLQQILPATAYDNDLLNDTVSIKDQWLENQQVKALYRARLQQHPVAVIIQTTAMNGYNGAIELLVGIYFDGSIAAVRVVSHQETPGLGDAIELQKSAWIEQFNQHGLIPANSMRWAVKRNGGDFDQLSGATITSTAVIQAVKKTLQYYQLHQSTVWNSPTKFR
jgi:electron transport complex protein RnfG